MKEIIVRENEAGQRLDKLLARYLNQASKSFFSVSYTHLTLPTN